MLRVIPLSSQTNKRQEKDWADELKKRKLNGFLLIIFGHVIDQFPINSYGKHGT